MVRRKEVGGGERESERFLLCGFAEPRRGAEPGSPENIKLADLDLSRTHFLLIDCSTKSADPGTHRCSHASLLSHAPPRGTMVR